MALNFFKVAVILAVTVFAVNCQNIRVNTGYGSRQISVGVGGGGGGYGGYGRGYNGGGGVQINTDPTGSSYQYSNGRYNGGGYGGYPGVYVNGRDYTGRNVNEPGLQINQSPYNYQYQ